jgi:hypothetical protein
VGVCACAGANAADASTSAAGVAGQAPTRKSDMKERAMEALQWGDFDELVHLHREASESTQLNFDGLPQLQSYMSGLGKLWNIGEPEATDAYFGNLDALTATWLKTHPGSSLAAALRMRALYARAWFYRGGGFANTVSQEQFALFGRYIEQALDLAREANIGPDDVMGHIYLVMVARSANMNWDGQRALSEDVLTRHPDSFGLWEELLLSAEPKWGGDWSLVSRLVLDAAKRQRTPEEGDMMYARLWDSAWYELKGTLFGAPVDWIRVKRGMRAVLARTPGTRMINAFGRLACLRRDRAAAQGVMDQIGDEPDLDFWGYGTTGRSAFDQCRLWLRDPESVPAPGASPPPGGRGASTQS